MNKVESLDKRRKKVEEEKKLNKMLNESNYYVLSKSILRALRDKIKNGRVTFKFDKRNINIESIDKCIEDLKKVMNYEKHRGIYKYLDGTEYWNALFKKGKFTELDFENQEICLLVGTLKYLMHL